MSIVGTEYPPELLLAPDLFPGVIAGEKTCTIRTGNRPIGEGAMIIRSNDGSIIWEEFDSILVRVTRVKHRTFKEITVSDLAAEGLQPWRYLWITPLMRRAFLNDMRRFYPDITPKSDVTVVHFKFSGDI